tara:strand:- start:423 stop:1322 length:900 start_codon:yes stop_codon:yes gene_type:complete
MSLLVVGSIALDSIKTPQASVNNIVGGSATYFSLSASKFTKVRLVAVVGRDFPKKYINLLETNGIDTEGLIRDNGETFRWQGEYGKDFSDAKTIATHLNVFANFRPKIPKSYQNTRLIFLANIDPQLQLQVLEQVKKPKLIACDTMNFWIESKRSTLLKLLKSVDAFLLNESEARLLTGEANLILAGKAISRFGPEIVLIKKGENGALLFKGSKIFTAPAYTLEEVVDPTGAGDTFAGGFMGYLAAAKRINDLTFRQAVIYGNIMATFAVESFGVNRLQKASGQEIKKRINYYRQLTKF